MVKLLVVKAGSLDHIQPVIKAFLYLFIYQSITSGDRWSIQSGARWSGAPALPAYDIFDFD